MESQRKLASVQVISDIQPIPEADLIEVATVNSWQLVVKKGQFSVGDKAIYCEIDSFLPEREEFEYLRKSSYRKMAGTGGFRLKTIKLKGQVSQGLLLPLETLTDKIHPQTYANLSIGDDVSEALGIVKFELPIPAQLMGVMKGNFPCFIPKTDEERIQNLTAAYENFRRNQFYVTEKLDGSSATFYHNNGVFGVCSRNIDLLQTEDNSFWKIAISEGIEEKITPIGNISLQGELIGEGIQSNPYKIKGQKVYFFNAWDIDKQCYYTYDAFIQLMNDLGLQHVPVLETVYHLPETIAELLQYAEDKSVLNINTEREGIVIRSHDRCISFKAISNKFLLKHSD